jgi:Spy/CpxP family protein refolding chaperone
MGNGPKQGAKFHANNMQGGQGRMNRLEMMKVRLKLTDEQASKISDLKYEHDKFVLDTKNGIAQNRLEVRKMMTDNKVDENKLLSLTSANSNLRSKMSEAKIKMWLNVYNILDDTQKTEWTKMFQHMGQKGMHGKKGGRKGNYGKSPQWEMR